MFGRSISRIRACVVSVVFIKTLRRLRKRPGGLIGFTRLEGSEAEWLMAL
ncbi:MAG: hypothetical protein QW212_00645 [Nitrososphaerales archaeon]